MIHNALQFITKTLDLFLLKQFQPGETKVILNKLIDLDGSVPTSNQNKIIISLANIEEDRVAQQLPPKLNAGPTNQNNNNLYVIYFLLSSNFDDYSESLEMLDASIGFFHGTSRFNATSFPDLPLEFLDLSLELCQTTLKEKVDLMLLTRNVPSVLFKMRLLSFKTVT